MKRISLVCASVIICTLFLIFPCSALQETPSPALSLNSKSACLMEFSSGEVLYEQNMHERLEPASVTKTMALLLIMEALDDGAITLDTLVTGSSHAASMGGSQIWLEDGEQMTVNEMLKAIVVSSANDCTVAMGEHLSGSEEAFVVRMNERAKELGMNDTNFVNCTGLPVENHYTSAYDIALMTRELLKHEEIFNYTTIWTDTVRGGEMGLSNTNKLIRFYNGANGMKTGYTQSALYCMSATAKRDGMQLIASVMKAETSDKRFSDAKKLLDHGFANYSVYTTDTSGLDSIPVKGGKTDSVKIVCNAKSMVIPRGRSKSIERSVYLEENLSAPLKKGQQVGYIIYKSEGEEIARLPIVTQEKAEKITLTDIFMGMLSCLCGA